MRTMLLDRTDWQHCDDLFHIESGEIPCGMIPPPV
jgi:hypothetical protein